MKLLQRRIILNLDQLKILAYFTANLALALLIAGVLTPVFSQGKLSDLSPISLLLTAVFLLIALRILDKSKEIHHG